MNQTKTNELTINASDIISPRFHGTIRDILKEQHTHYYFKGGRGSTKSSMLSVMLVIIMMRDPNAHAVVLRRVADTLRESVVSQIEWAIEKLGVSHEWKKTVSPLQFTRISTGQKIMFRGADNPEKIKSLKVSRGYMKIIWFEELSEFRNPEAIRNIRQSLARGGEQLFFYSYNPPKSLRNWVNAYVETQKDRDDVLVHSSTYRTVPKEWLGSVFLAEAEDLKRTNPQVYKHEYLGEPVGTGAEVFTNIVTRNLTNEEIAGFDVIYQGLDFGFAADPLAYVKLYHDKARRRITFIDEIYKPGLPNKQAVDEIKLKNPDNGLVTADSAEPRTIHEFKSYGLWLKPARKGPDSIAHGIKWLQDLNEIIIDPRRTPNIYREFSGYELEEDKFGNLKGVFPDKDNHSIDATRYALEDTVRNDIKTRKQIL
jgi:PBSX family phage terminase large subunit